MKFPRGIRSWLLMATILTLALTSSAVYAHDRREVAGHQFVVGWIVEPAFEGLKNGVDLRVTEGSESTPVEGVEKALKVEVTHVPSGQSKVMDLRTIFRDPGHYTADVIPTAPGHYRFRFFGTLEGDQVNLTFDSRSGGGGFDDIGSSADIQFPERLPAIREVQGAATGAQSAAQQAQSAALEAEDSSSTARTLAILGIVLGAVGILSGIGGAAVAMIRR